MTQKLLILMIALMLAGCVGRPRTNSTENAEPSAVENSVAPDSINTATAVEMVAAEIDYELVADPDILAKIDVARYRKYGLIKIETIDPFVVLADEKITLKDPETANGGLNDIRFEGWGDKEWLNNNYIRSVRLYLDAYILGLVKNEEFDKYKEAMKGKFCICSIEPFMGGGAWMHIAFVDDTSFSLRFWVYSFLSETNPVVIDGYDVRSADLIDEPLGITTEEIKEILKQNPHNQLW